MFLTIPATSVPSERVFSAAGLTITKQRSSLDPSVAHAIIFMNKYNKSRLHISKTSSPVPEPSVAIKLESSDQDIQVEIPSTEQGRDIEPPLPSLPEMST